MKITAAIALGLLIGLSGCGFHPRGAVSLPQAMAVTHIQGPDAFSVLVTDLERQLRSAGVQVSPQREGAAVLRIEETEVNRRVLSVDLSGKAREYELFQQLSFTVVDSENRELVPRQDLALRRDYVFDATDVLGKVNEDEVVRQDMERELARRILQRIQVLSAGR